MFDRKSLMFCNIGDVTAVSAVSAVEYGMVILVLMILILRTVLIDMGPAFLWSVIWFAFLVTTLFTRIDCMTRPMTISTFDIIVAMFLFHFRNVFSAWASVLIVGLVSVGFTLFATSSTAVMMLCEIGFVVDGCRCYDRGFFLSALFLCCIAGFYHCI